MPEQRPDEKPLAAKLRAAYGRGRFDGIQETEMAMNAARLDEAIRNATATAKRVLDSVPMEEAWHLDRIYADVCRRGIRMEKHVVHGCLKALVDDGIVREHPSHHYVRVQPKPVIVRKVTKLEPAIKPAASIVGPSETTERTPMERLIVALSDLAADVKKAEEAALEFASQVEELEAKLAKFKQLQDLLKGLS